MNKISIKIIVAIALCSTLLATIIGIISIRTFSNKLTDKSEEGLMQLSIASAAQIKLEFGLIENTVNNIAIQAGINFDNTRAIREKGYVNKYFVSLRKYLKAVSMNSENNIDGYILLDTIFAKTPYVDELLYLKNSRGAFEYKPPLNLVMSVNRNKEKYEWYFKPMEQKKGMWIDMYLDSALNKLMISYVTPIKSNNKVIGMTGMDISIEGLKKLVEQIRPYKGSYAFMVNNKNEFVVHPKYKFKDKLNSVANGKYIKLVEKFNKSKNGYIQLDNEVIGFSELTNNNRLCIIVPKSQILHEVTKLTRTIIIIIFIGVIIAMVTAYLIGKKIANPIGVLIENMNSVEAGKFNLAIHTNSKDEIGLLYDKFNSMVHSLKLAKEDIEMYTRDLESKNAELERFTYTVSHDLKSPLITIKGFSGAISSDLNSGRYDRAEADLKRIENASEKMEELLEGLLELSRIGRVVNAPEDFSILGLVEDIHELLFGSISSKGITLRVDPQIPRAYGDKNRIGEVFQNLIENSVKFMDKPEGIIEVGYIEKNDEIIYYVRDNGMGISERYHDKIFGLFDKLNSSIPGTGIGLALVKRIVEFHQGRIWVESELTKGSQFYFTLGLKQNQIQ